MDRVIQKPTSPSKKSTRRSNPGRPAQFDRDAVIDGAVNLFWRNGYSGSSLDTIARELGVNRSTLYGSFGGKDGLWQSANDAYLANLKVVMIDPLLMGNGGLADIDAFIDRLCEVVLSEDFPPGCLVINDMATAKDDVFLRKYTTMFHDGLTEALERAAALGEIDASSVQSIAARLLTEVIGLNMMAKAGVGAELAQSAIEGIQESVRTLT